MSDSVNVTFSESNVTVDFAPPTVSVEFNSILEADIVLSSYQAAVDLIAAWKHACATSYSEYTYSGDDLVGIDVWKTSEKSIKFFTKTFSYGGGKLLSTALTDWLNGVVLTTSFEYAGDNLISKSMAIS